MQSPYSHLLTGVSPSLETVSCLQLEDIRTSVNLQELFDFAGEFFPLARERPYRVDYDDPDSDKGRRCTFRTFGKRFGGTNLSVGAAIRAVAFSGRGFEPDPGSDTWTPKSALIVHCIGKVLYAFLYAPELGLRLDGAWDRALQFFDSSNFSNANLFKFPRLFSPRAYASGISYSANRPGTGKPNFTDGERHVRWAAHCYRGRRASEGYMRDIYSLNLIGPHHLERRIGGHDLATWIARDRRRGRLEPYRDRHLWSVAHENLLLVQRELDAAQFLLSGFSPD